MHGCGQYFEADCTSVECISLPQRRLDSSEMHGIASVESRRMQCNAVFITVLLVFQINARLGGGGGVGGGQLIRDRNLFGRLLPPNHLSLLTKIGNKTRVDVFLPPTEK